MYLKKTNKEELVVQYNTFTTKPEARLIVADN